RHRGGRPASLRQLRAVDALGYIRQVYMNKKKLFLTFALIALIACAAVMLFAGCEMITDPAEPHDIGVADMDGGVRLLAGLPVAAIGLLVVFVVLIVLIFLIKGLKMLREKLEQASTGRGKDRAARNAEAEARRAAEKQAKIDAARARVE